jgi:adenosylhomocysteine nucleosidase
VSVTGIVAALTAEARTLNPLPKNRLVALSGMGPQAAARAAQDLVAAGAEALLSFGLAGALDPNLEAGAVVLPQTVIDGGGATYAAYDPWRDRLAAQVASMADATPVVGGALLSVAQPLSTVDAKSQARVRTGACAVDMESFAIAEVAARMNVRFAVARVVIDGATEALPLSVIQATGKFGEVNLPRLVAGLVSAPADVSLLLRLPRRYRAAMHTLRALAQLDLGLP